jgi:hypothetical protein
MDKRTIHTRWQPAVTGTGRFLFIKSRKREVQVLVDYQILVFLFSFFSPVKGHRENTVTGTGRFLFIKSRKQILNKYSMFIMNR